MPLMPLTPLFHNRYFPHDRFERSPQFRGDHSGAVAIEDCWLWLIMAENSFSKTIIRLRQRFATANNSHTQISRPRRHRLTNPSSLCKKRTRRQESPRSKSFCGERGIRTPETLLGFTRFPGGPVQPLLHLSFFATTKIVFFAKFRNKISFSLKILLNLQKRTIKIQEL